MNTQRDVYILNFIHSATWCIYSSPLLIRSPRHRPPGLYGKIFIVIALSNTNYVSPAATRLMWPMVRVGWRIFPSSANRQSKTAIFNHKSQKQIKKAYHTHSSFLTKHHIDGIVAMLDVSNVDNVCVCLKRSDQFALKQGHLPMVPLTWGHLPYKVTLGLLKGWPYKRLSICIPFTKYIF